MINMKTITHKIISAIILLAHMACVNNLEELKESNIPIRFQTDIRSEITTRIANNSFEKSDKIGLYTTISPATLKEARYIDNVLLSYKGEGQLIPEKDLFYPEGEGKLNFTAYYPYQSQSIAQGESTLNIAVKASQEKDEDFSSSDFLVAQTPDVAYGKDNVLLEFEHKLVKICVSITPPAEILAEELLNAKPAIIGTDFYTEATYDFNNDTFTPIASTSTIIPHGTWKTENGKLKGKEFIIIPQELKEQRIIIEWAGRTYTCNFEETTLTEGTLAELTIDINKIDDQYISTISTEIKEWGNSMELESETDITMNTIYTTPLTFTSSDVYRIYHNNDAVAEICKEYLYKENIIATQAIVLYPVINGKTNLQAGTVLELIGNNEKIHGGSVCWNEADTTLTYTPGTSEAIKQFYIDHNKQITFEAPNQALQVSVNSYMLRDIRNEVLQSYPIVKIGIQYWMKADLRATYYNDDTPINKITNLNGSAGYYYNETTKAYYYTGEALETNKLSPDNWRIAKGSDWKALKKYVNGNAALIKGGEWIKLNDNELHPFTNETGLDIRPNGLFILHEGKSLCANENTSVAYWMASKTSDASSGYTLLLSSKHSDFESKEDVPAAEEFYNAYTIRCVKE
ncbi:MAG: hypothetical protein E7099_03220 [Mediterranea massiliensis]|nr:hypothetical protein [Mediterranea massiliensis]